MSDITSEENPLVARMRPHAQSIFGEMSQLATRTQSINLGQGFPDTDGPPEVTQAAIRAIESGKAINTRPHTDFLHFGKPLHLIRTGFIPLS